MSKRSRFLLCGAALVVLAAMGGTYFANVIVLGKAAPIALKESIDALSNWFAILFLYLPAAAIALIAAAVARRRSARASLIVFAAGTIPLVVLYVIGHWNAAVAMSQHNGRQQHCRSDSLQC